MVWVPLVATGPMPLSIVTVSAPATSQVSSTLAPAATSSGVAVKRWIASVSGSVSFWRASQPTPAKAMVGSRMRQRRKGREGIDLS
jgi:hypothetical protein